MTTVGIVSPGFMGAGLGQALRTGGARVVTTLDGRSARSARLATDAGLEVLPSLAAVLAASDVILSVVPPGQAVATAHAIATAARAAGLHADPSAGSTRGSGTSSARDAITDPSREAGGDSGQQVGGGSGQQVGGGSGRGAGAGLPVVADLNAVSPETMAVIARALDGLPVVDGSISGPPPTTAPGAHVYLSGLRAAEVAALPWDGQVEPVVLGPEIGTASALKMCTAGVYKGLTALLTQALRTAGHHGVLDPVLADLARNGFTGSAGIARSATKAARFVDEMREIAATQAGAGLTPALFQALADVYADIATTPLAQGAPESTGDLPPAEIVNRLTSR
ncbi:DUF1932 domain-containing protein [Actinoplanes palleronii]|uniref:Phosphogluconate dehydrogenase NAD-binding putative C-terminal domain-containing protein n=1 Tax=Actinoplanes palleronii TaxID=113570 RepID=A0ABQ4BE99_9ACTN|nr:DUF1932 domain-containing protein [Actinoplanes palleronii]GIE68666.1 hypothetical protein Apa02nite_047740 [Actinoplanes palleronii]